MRLKHFLAAILLTCLAAGSEAQLTPVFLPLSESVGKLIRIGTSGAEGLFLTLDVDTTNNSCSNKDMLFMARDHPQYRETLSIALLSLAQARPLKVRYDRSCLADAVKLYDVSVSTNP